MKRISIIFIFALLVCSCVFDNIAPDDCPAGKTRLSLSMREMQVKETRSAATTNECWISDALIFVFDSNGKYKSGEVVSVENAVTGNGNTTPSIETSLSMADGDSIVVLCNTGMSYLPNLTKGVSTTNDINEQVDCLYTEINQEGADGGKCLPMSGIAEWNHATPPSISMYRSVAKFQLLINIPQGRDMTGEFTRDGVKWTMCHMPEKSHVFSRNGELNVPEPNQYYDDLTMSKRAVGAAGASAGQLAYYVFEAENSTASNLLQHSFVAARTCLIVETAAGFYRIDIAELSKYDHALRFLPIRRNFDYRVIVTSVKSNGYPTLEEALENPGSNVEYDVVIDGDDDNSITSNGQYAVATDRSVTSVTHDVTTPENLVKFSCLGVSAPRVPTDIMTRKVRLVGADKKTLVPTSVIQLCKSDGTAVVGNEFTFTKDEEKDYQLKYTSSGISDFDIKECYVEVNYGNIRHYVTVDPCLLNLHAKNSTATTLSYYHVGGEGSFVVESSSNKDGRKLDYEITGFSIDGGKSWSSKAPDWMSYKFPSDMHNGTVDVTVQPQTGTNEQNKKLKATPAVSGVYNLANQTNGGANVENTANCYIVNAPGTYSIPLVYGNAIKNGVDNRSSYHTDIEFNGGSQYFLEDMLRHDGQAITSPNIEGAVSAELVWSDEESLVQNVLLERYFYNQMLQFTVPAETIRQGNAIVAVKNAAGQILWSWHIWVTDYKLTDPSIPFANSDGEVYDFMPVNLGWCDPIDFERRNVLVRIRQKETGFEKTLEIVQNEYQFLGNCSLYNWGRKDPLAPQLFDKYTRAFIGLKGYLTKEYPTISSSDRAEAVTLSILNPNCVYKNWISYPYQNSWDMNKNYLGLLRKPLPWNNLTKTVYDPSPVGYHVPEAAAFIGLDSTSPSGIGYEYDSQNLIWTITSFATNQSLTLPIVGYLHSYTAYYWNGHDSFAGLTVRSDRVKADDASHGCSHWTRMSVRPTRDRN